MVLSEKVTNFEQYIKSRDDEVEKLKVKLSLAESQLERIVPMLVDAQEDVSVLFVRLDAVDKTQLELKRDL